jgi:methylated-DNA-[protein]-cysteine S-methyltransferase
MNEIEIQYYKTPLGELVLGSINSKLCLCDWRYRKMRKAIDDRILKVTDGVFVERSSDLIELAKAELDEYFSGTRKIFSVPYLLAGTDFQKRVWDELIKIPFGNTETYMGLSRKLNNPNLTRAVAAANGANALAIFVPCHRIIGSHGELTGYAGGLKAKQYLLNHEDGMRLF